MRYYCIRYRYSKERHGIYSYLPVTSEVTTDLKTAYELFDRAVKAQTLPWKGNKLEFVKDHKLDYMCYIKEALFHCTEAAYQEGYYVVELSCYTINPFV